MLRKIVETEIRLANLGIKRGEETAYVYTLRMSLINCSRFAFQLISVIPEFSKRGHLYEALSGSTASLTGLLVSSLVVVVMLSNMRKD